MARLISFGLPLALILVAAALGAGLMVYAQTSAFTGDEGFHLLAAQLIDKGKRPYIDFAFPQTPLNAYFNAWIMRVFGQTWRVPHAAAVMLAVAAALLAAQFAWRRFPASEKWRTAIALTVCIIVLTNAMTVEYGSVAQAYALSMFLTVAALRFAVAAVARPSPLAAFLAGLAAGAAAASTLLTATAGAVFLLWIFFANRDGDRWIKTAGYFAGCVIPFAPVAWLWMQAPRPVIFNLIEYHLFFRKVYWPQTTQHDLEIIASWIDSGQALLLLLLSAIGLAFIIFRSQWKNDVRREFYLCAWLSLAICAEISTAHPTFARYYVLVVPFAAILAAAGVYTVSERLYRPEAPYLAVAALTALLGLGLAKSLYQRASDVRTWATHEQMAKKVEQITPPNAPIFADEEIYFLTRRTPPEGMEFEYSHKLKLEPSLAKQLHIVDQDQINRMAGAGKFAAVATCDDEFLNAMRLNTIFTNQFETDDCYVYWGKAIR